CLQSGTWSRSELRSAHLRPDVARAISAKTARRRAAEGAPMGEDTTSFAGKAVLVTGGTSGIGRATALAFARRGAAVAIVRRDAERGREVCEACRALGVAAAFLAADVARPAAAQAIVDFALAELGRLDVAFNNAAFQEPRALLAEQPDETYERVL